MFERYVQEEMLMTDNELNEMIERVLIQRNKTVDNMILGEIRKIATENGIDTIITLNEKAIIQALKNFAEVKHGKWLPIVKQDNYLDPPYCDTIKCSECGEEADVSFHDAKYCYMCGAKMDGGKAE
jgi:hypothetical protein